MNDDFALDLIIAEEMRQPETGGGEGPPRYADQTVVMERTNFTTSTPFVVGDSQRSFPLFGVGTLDPLLLVTDTESYSVEIETDVDSDFAGGDESTFLADEDFATLEEISAELTRVSAFENNQGDKVLSVGPVDFLDAIRVVVRPSAPVTFKRQRAEVTFERDV